MCLEIAKPGQEYRWREQMIFHGAVADEHFDHAHILEKPTRDWGLEETLTYTQALQDGDRACIRPMDMEHMVDGGI